MCVVSCVFTLSMFCVFVLFICLPAMKRTKTPAAPIHGCDCLVLTFTCLGFDRGVQHPLCPAESEEILACIEALAVSGESKQL